MNNGLEVMLGFIQQDLKISCSDQKYRDQYKKQDLNIHQKCNKKPFLRLLMDLISYVRLSQEWAKQQCSYHPSYIDWERIQNQSVHWYYVMLESWHSRFIKSSIELGST